MTHVINPWLFYLIDLLTSLDDLFFTAIILFTALLCALALQYFYMCNEYDYCINHTSEEDDEPELKKFNSIMKKLKKSTICACVGLVLSSVIAVVIPKQETMYQMLMAYSITDENIEIAVDSIKECVDYIFEKFEQE